MNPIPIHLQRTLFVVDILGIVTASDVAEKTGRSRANESHILNQLVLMGELESFNHGKKKYFKKREVRAKW